MFIKDYCNVLHVIVKNLLSMVNLDWITKRLYSVASYKDILFFVSLSSQY